MRIAIPLAAAAALAVACGDDAPRDVDDVHIADATLDTPSDTSDSDVSDAADAPGRDASDADAAEFPDAPVGDVGDSADAAEVPLHPMLDGFQAIAHRGGGRLAPEATMPAYESAASIGVDALECDVHSTSDGVLVCIHDDTVDRTTDGTGRVHDFTFEALRLLDAGARFTRDGGETFPYRDQGVVIPTLREVLEAYPDHPWTVEIKQSTPSIAADVVALVEELDRVHDVAIASFFDPTIAEVRAANTELVTALTASEMVRFVSMTAAEEERYEPPGLLIQAPFSEGADLLTPERVARAHRFGMRIHVWTLNDRASMEDAIARGADGIFTDDPALLRRVLDGE